MTILSALAALALLAETPPAAAAPAEPAPVVQPAQPAAVEAEAEAEAPKICKVRRQTGSRLAKTRTCMTKAEWAKIARDSAKSVTMVRDKGGAPQHGGRGELPGG